MHPAAIARYQDYLSKGTQFKGTTTPVGTPVPRYAMLESDDEPLLPFVETAKLTCGFPHLLKAFKFVAFVGKGTLFIRALIDGVPVAKGYVTLGENPEAPSLFRFPVGSIGRSVVLQITGTGTWSQPQLLWDPVGGE